MPAIQNPPWMADQPALVGEENIERAEAGNCIGFKMEIFQIWKEGKLLSPLSLPTGRILYLKENCNVIRKSQSKLRKLVKAKAIVMLSVKA